jgi:hypothetical protein
MTNKIKLTNRGKWVVGITIAIITYLIFSWLYEITTPDTCKVPIDEMSHFCIDLLYPHS